MASIPDTANASPKIDHVVLLIHGIRDPGAWHKTVSQQLKAPGTKIIRVRYAYWSAFRFLGPIPLAWLARVHIKRAYYGVRQEYPKAKVSVIAHSFGTYVLLSLLKRDSYMRLWKVIFCGSVAKDLEDWSIVEHKIGEHGRPKSEFIVNDCGTGDYWPIIGASAGWYYGMAGTVGFNEVYVTNRYHRGPRNTPGTHGLYFDPEFVTKHWRPFLIENQALDDGDGEQGEHIPSFIRLLYYPAVSWVLRILVLALWLTIVSIPIVAAGAIAMTVFGCYPSEPNASLTFEEFVKQVRKYERPKHSNKPVDAAGWAEFAQENQGKWVRWSCIVEEAKRSTEAYYVRSLETQSTGPGYERAYVSFASNCPIEFVLGSRFKPGKVGETVTIVGRIEEVTPDIVFLSDCRFVDK